MGSRFFLGRSPRKQRSLTKMKLKELKELLDITIFRLYHLRSQCHSRCTQFQADIGPLLLLGQLERALLYAEWVIIELDKRDVFAMLVRYCILLSERSLLLLDQRGLSLTRKCPKELQEAAAGLVYAAPRCDDLPLLPKLRCIFASIFGQGFTDAVDELRFGCGVRSEMVLRFSNIKPSLESRVRLVSSIAREQGIELNLANPAPQGQTSTSHDR